MANVTIVSTANSIKVDLGIYAAVPAIGYSKVTIPKDKLIDIKLKSDNSFVEAVVLNDGKWTVSFDDSVVTALKVDSVDAVAPTSNSDLYDKLIALIA